MADELRFKVTADGADQAAADVAKVQDAVDGLEGTTASVSVDADDQATPTIDDVQSSTDDLDGTDAEVAVDADDQATGTLDDVQSSVDDLDGTDAEVAVDVDDNASQPLEKVGSSVDGLIGKLGNLPGPLGEIGGLLGDIGGGGGAAAIAGLTGAIGGAAAAAMKGVGDFQNLGIEVDNFATKTGASFDAASRFIEVAKDLGVNVDTLETSIGRMNKAAEDTPDKFDEIGASIVRNQDGTLNSVATFENVVARLNEITDAGKRADAGNQIFGRGWQNMSELVGMSADELQARLQDVADTKIFDQSKIDQSKGLRDAFDSINDAVDDLFLTIGQDLAPAITALAPAFGQAVEALKPLTDAVGSQLAGELADIVPLFQAVGDSMSAWSNLQLPGWLSDIGNIAQDAVNPVKNMVDQFDKVRDRFGSTPELSGSVADGFGKVATSADGLSTSATAAADAAKLQADALKAGNDVLDAAAKLEDAYVASVKASIAALADQSNGFTSAADDQRSYNAALDDFAAKAKDGKTSADDLGDAAIKAAKDHAALYSSLTTAAGGVVTLTGKLDAQNDTLLTTAAAASGPARQGILDYTYALNGIPPDVQTQITAALNRGDVDEAKRLLDEASANRTATVAADADAASLASTNRALDNTAKDRTATIYVKTTPTGVQLGNWTNATQTVNALGAPTPATVSPSATTRGVGVEPAHAAVVNNVTVTNNIQVPRIPSGRELDRISARWARVNGRR